MSNYKTTHHRDGTVTLWSVYRQSWQRIAAEDVSDETLSTLPADERAKIRAMALGITTKWTTVKERPYAPVTDDDGAAAGGVVLIQRRRHGDEIQERKVAANFGRHVAGKAYEI
jgi:hypothetical protein